MKLIICQECNDIVALRRTMRRCECGKTYGHYKPDGLTAEVSENAISLAIGNGALVAAIKNLKFKQDDKRYMKNCTREGWIQDASVQFVWVRPNEGAGNPHTSVIKNSRKK
jgi:hypothetical protein